MASYNPVEYEQDGKCTYQVTLLHFYVTMFTKEKK
jgi:hypothetical protein